MSKNIQSSRAREEMFRRIDALSPTQAALWGRMKVSEMLCHATDQLRIAVGEIKTAATPQFSGQTFAKWMVLAGMPLPKGKIKTFKEIDAQYGGTPPTEFDRDRETLKVYIQRIGTIQDVNEVQPHGFFGPLSPRQWGRLAWLHLDHHLRQFGG